MGIINKVTIGTNTYSIGSSIYGVCDTAAATAAKEVTIDGFTSNCLVDGATIRVRMVNANSAASPTLNVSGTGAKGIAQYGTTAAGTSESNDGWYANSIMLLTYDSTLDRWVLNRGYNYNSNSGDYNLRECYAKAKAKNAIYRHQLLFASGNYVVPVCGTNNSTAMTKTAFYNDAFDIFGTIYCYDATTTVNKDSITANGVLYTTMITDMRYSFNNFSSTAASSQFAQGDMVYFVATPQTATTAKPYYGANGTTYTACVTKTLPTSEDGLIYIQLGLMYDSYRMHLSLNHPVYCYKDGAIKIYTPDIVLPTAGNDTLGVVKTTSSVTDVSGYTACPIVEGVPYYKEGGGGSADVVQLTSSAGIAGLNGFLVGNTVTIGVAGIAMSAIAANGTIATYTNAAFSGKKVQNIILGRIGNTLFNCSATISGTTMTVKTTTAISAMASVIVTGTFVIF